MQGTVFLLDIVLDSISPESAEGLGIHKEGKTYFLLFLDEKKQKSPDCTELAKNPKLTLKPINSTHTPERFLNALTADFLYANSVMSVETNPAYVAL